MAGAGLGAAVNKSTEAVVDGAASTTPTHRQRSWSDALATPLRCIAAAAMLGVDTKTEGGIRPDGTDGSLQLALGKKLSGVITPEGGGTVAIRFVIKNPASSTGFAAIWGSATIIDEYNVVTAAHHFTGREVVAIDVRTGPNFRTDPGTIHQVEKWHVNPAYVNDASRDRELDIAMLNLATPMNTLRPTFSTERPAVGSQVALCGFGLSGTQAEGLNPRQTGSPEAGTSKIFRDSVVSTSGQSPKLYVAAEFSNQSAQAAEQRAAPGDSGGTVFVLDEQGRVLSIAGMIVSTSIPLGGFFTYFLDLTNPTVQFHIDAHKKKPDVRLAISHSSDGVLVTWPPAPNNVLQSAPSLQGPWTDRTNVISTTSGNSATFLYSDLPDGAGVFRLSRKN